MDESDIIIRELQDKDRLDVRRISCETAFLKEAGSGLFDDDEILADALTAYFTDYEPGSCFVAEKDGKVIGYIIGSKNTTAMAKTFKFRIAPKLLLKSIRRGLFLKRGAWIFLLHCLASFLKGEFWVPDLSKEYPATLHINIDEDFRGLRLGTRLIEYYLGFLREKGIKGVHFGTSSEGAKTFFLKSGFELLFEGKRTFLKYAMGKDLSYYIFGRRL
ncbi:MAG: GNAT family N-acetyltransferase [Candidatus Omnitrophota bacterium]